MKLMIRNGWWQHQLIMISKMIRLLDTTPIQSSSLLLLKTVLELYVIFSNCEIHMANLIGKVIGIHIQLGGPRKPKNKWNLVKMTKKEEYSGCKWKILVNTSKTLLYVNTKKTSIILTKITKARMEWCR